MPLFRSVAKDSQGNKYAGTFEAPDRESALQMLKSQGYIVASLEVVPEDEVERGAGPLPKARLAPAQTGMGKNWGKAKVQKPAGRGGGILKLVLAGIAILVVIPSSIYFFGPQKPRGNPEGTMRAYYALETVGDYAGQFRLFTRRRKALWVSEAQYTESRKNESSARSAADAAAAGAEVQAAPETPPRSENPEIGVVLGADARGLISNLEVTLQRGDALERVLFRLEPEERAWKIDDIRLLERKKAPVETAKPVRAAPKASAPQAEPDLEAVKRQALAMLEQAYQSGKVDEAAYQEKKKAIALLKKEG